MANEILGKIIQSVFGFLQKKATEEVAKPVAPVTVAIEPEAPSAAPAIDWNDGKSKLSENFSVKEALFLPSWGVSHNPSDEEKVAIKGIAEKVTKAVKTLEAKLGKPVHINVHAWMRPAKANIPDSKWNGHDYNRYIYETQVWKDLSAEEKAKKTVPNSPHKTGHAIDFHVVGYEGKEGCRRVREMLLPHLEELGLRMEDMAGGWIHLDDLPVVHQRFFRP